MQNEKNKVEAVLFTTGRFMEVDEIARLCGIGSVGIVKELLGQLKNDYEAKGGALTILSESNKWKLNIRREYNYLTTNLLSDSEFNEAVTKTLALIAYKQPVLQSEIINIRGNGAYDHIKILKQAEFLTSEKNGRTRLLKLASKFFDYFDLVEAELKQKLSYELPRESVNQELEGNLNEDKG